MVSVTTHRPAVVSATLSMLAAAAALAAIATSTTQRLSLLLTLGAVVPVVLGVELHHRRQTVAGLVAVVVGLAGGGGALAFLVTRTGSFSLSLELIPGLLGLFVLAFGFGPAWKNDTRLLISAGTGLVLVSVITSLGVYETDTTGVLVGGIATILAWDLGEQAVNIGEQIGREAATTRVELVHGGVTAGVGVLAVGGVLVVRSFDVTGVPLTGLAGLLGAGLMLTLALYN